MRCKHPDSNPNMEGHLLIIVDKVVNKTITELCFSYEEPLVLLENTPLTTMMQNEWEQQEP